MFISIRFAALPQAQQPIGCGSDVAQHVLVFVADVMANTAAFDAFSTHEGHTAAVPLYKYEIEIIVLMCGNEHDIARWCLE